MKAPASIRIITITDLARNIRHWLDEAQEGRTIIVVRYGKPIVQIVPYKEENNDKAASMT